MNQHENSQCGEQITHILSMQIQQVTSYIDYLNNIKTAITNNKTEQLNELVKEQLVNPELIEQTRQQQAKLLTQHGYELTESGLKNCILDCGNSAQMQSLHSELTEKLKELEKSLAMNALLVQKSQLRVKQSIRLLAGHALTNSPSSYSRKGNVDNNENNKHILAQA